MSAIRIALWAVVAIVVAAIVFLAATIRVVEPQTATAEPAVAVPAASSDAAAQPAPEVPASYLTVPVAGVARASLRGNWGDAREGGARAHEGLDIMAPRGTPVVAAADGVVEKLFYSNGGGGITLYQRASNRRWMFYYAHLDSYAAGMAEGRPVRAGETIAYVGDTGNAGAGNTHLHFGVSKMRPGEPWHRGTPVDPYPLLARTAAAR